MRNVLPVTSSYQVIDLLALGEPESSPYVDAARAGGFLRQAAATTNEPADELGFADIVPAGIKPLPLPGSLERPLIGFRVHPGTAPDPMLANFVTSGTIVLPPQPFKTKKLFVVGLTAISFIVLCMAGLHFYLKNQPKDEFRDRAEQQADAMPQPSATPASSALAPPLFAPPPHASVTNVAIATTIKSVAVPTPSAIPASSKPKLPPIFAVLDSAKLKLKLPETLTKPGQVPQPAILTTLNLPNNCECKLKLIGISDAFPADRRQVTLDEHSTRSWRVNSASVIFGKAGTKEPAAEFTLDDMTGELRFQWMPVLPAEISRDALSQCLLKIEIGDESRVCRMAEPIKALPLRLIGAIDSPKPPAGVQYAEFSAESNTAIAPLLGPKLNAAGNPNNPRLKIVFLWPKELELRIKTQPLPAGRTGVGFSIPDAPCRLEIFLDSVNQNSGTSLAFRVSLFGQLVTFDTIKKVWSTQDDVKLSADLMNKADASLDGEVRVLEQYFRDIENRITALENNLRDWKVKRDQANLPLPNPTPVEIERSQQRLNEILRQIDRIEKIDLPKEKKKKANPEFSKTETRLTLAREYLETQRRTMATLRAFQDSFLVGYRIYLVQPESAEVLLYDTEAQPESSADIHLDVEK